MSRLNVTGQISMPSGNRQVNVVVVGSPLPIGDVATVPVVSGDTTVPLPVGVIPLCALLVPQGVPTATIMTVRSVFGDTGISLSCTDPTLLSFNTGSIPANLYVHGSAAGGEIEISFF